MSLWRRIKTLWILSGIELSGTEETYFDFFPSKKARVIDIHESPLEEALNQFS
jgi:hypothetical protein